jgi:hypothetical protein
MTEPFKSMAEISFQNTNFPENLTPVYVKQTHHTLPHQAPHIFPKKKYLHPEN